MSLKSLSVFALFIPLTLANSGLIYGQVQTVVPEPCG